MPTIVMATMFVGKQRPLCTKAADGTFQVTLRLLDRVGPESRSVESWLVRWAGSEAADWWLRNEHQVVPGQPLNVVLLRPRVFYTGHGDFRSAELHAAVKHLSLAPRRGTPPCPAVAPSTARAQTAATI
jgi:hypothetical protein